MPTTRAHTNKQTKGRELMREMLLMRLTARQSDRNSHVWPHPPGFSSWAIRVLIHAFQVFILVYIKSDENRVFEQILTGDYSIKRFKFQSFGVRKNHLVRKYGQSALWRSDSCSRPVPRNRVLGGVY